MNDERTGLDPNGQYPAEGLRLVEQNAQRVLGLLKGGQVERTRDAVQIDHGGDRGIVVLVTREAFEFRLPTVEWTCGAYGPAQASRLWRRVKAQDVSDERLQELLQKAIEARQAEFKKCRFCGKSFAPEHRSAGACHGCAERHLGIVY